MVKLKVKKSNELNFGTEVVLTNTVDKLLPACNNYFDLARVSHVAGQVYHKAHISWPPQVGELQ